MSHEINGKLEALIKFCIVPPHDVKNMIKVPERSTEPFECYSGEYLVLTDEEAHAAVSEAIAESLWAFKPEFILQNMPQAEKWHVQVKLSFCKALLTMQDELCECANPIIEALIPDLEQFIINAVDSESTGRGHFLAGYDGQEEMVSIQGTDYYIYRVN